MTPEERIAELEKELALANAGKKHWAEVAEKLGEVQISTGIFKPHNTLKDQLLLAAWECLRQHATTHESWPRIDPDSITTLLRKMDETEKKLEWTEQKLQMSYEANTQLDEDMLRVKLELEEIESRLQWTQDELQTNFNANTFLDEDRTKMKQERDVLKQQLIEARRWLLLFATIDGYEIVNVSEDKEQAALRYRITLSVAAHERLEKFVAALREG